MHTVLDEGSVQDSPLFRTITEARAGEVMESVGLDSHPSVDAVTRLSTPPESGVVYVAISVPTALVQAGAIRILARNLLALGVVAMSTFVAAWNDCVVPILRG